MLEFSVSVPQGFADGTENRCADMGWQDGPSWWIGTVVFAGQRPGEEELWGTGERNLALNALFYYWKSLALRTSVNLHTWNADNIVFNKVAKIYFKSVTRSYVLLSNYCRPSALQTSLNLKKLRKRRSTENLRISKWKKKEELTWR